MALSASGAGRRTLDMDSLLLTFPDDMQFHDARHANVLRTHHPEGEKPSLLKRAIATLATIVPDALRLNQTAAGTVGDGTLIRQASTLRSLPKDVFRAKAVHG